MKQNYLYIAAVRSTNYMRESTDTIEDIKTYNFKQITLC